MTLFLKPPPKAMITCAWKVIAFLVRTKIWRRIRSRVHFAETLQRKASVPMEPSASSPTESRSYVATWTRTPTKPSPATPIGRKGTALMVSGATSPTRCSRVNSRNKQLGPTSQHIGRSWMLSGLKAKADSSLNFSESL